MAYEEILKTISAEAAADLSAHQFKIVQQTTTGINLANATSDLLGVLQDKPAALGRAGSVAVAGVTKLKCTAAAAGTAIAAGDLLASSTVGLGVKAAASTSVNVNIIGEAMEALSTGNSATLSVLLDKRILPPDLST